MRIEEKRKRRWLEKCRTVDFHPSFLLLVGLLFFNWLMAVVIGGSWAPTQGRRGTEKERRGPKKGTICAIYIHRFQQLVTGSCLDALEKEKRRKEEERRREEEERRIEAVKNSARSVWGKHAASLHDPFFVSAPLLVHVWPWKSRRIATVIQERIALWKARTAMARKDQWTFAVHCVTILNHMVPPPWRVGDGGKGHVLKNIRRPSLRWPCQGSSKRRMGAVSCQMISLLVRDLSFRWQVVGSPRWSRTKYSSRHEKHSNLRYFFSWQIQPATRKLCDPNWGFFFWRLKKCDKPCWNGRSRNLRRRKRRPKQIYGERPGETAKGGWLPTPIRSHRLVRSLPRPKPSVSDGRRKRRTRRINESRRCLQQGGVDDLLEKWSGTYTLSVPGGV